MGDLPLGESWLGSLASIDSLLREAESTAISVDEAIYAMLALKHSLHLRIKALQRQRAHLEQSLAAARHNLLTQSPEVCINVRGMKFEAKRDLLLRNPGTYFSAMILASPCQKEYFIDRAFEGFGLVLAYMGDSATTSRDCDKSEYSIDCADEDLKYYRLLPMDSSTRIASALSDLSISFVTELPKHGSIFCGGDHGAIQIVPCSVLRSPFHLFGHQGTILGALEVHDGRLCTISADSTLRMWDIERRTTVAKLEYDRHHSSVFEKRGPSYTFMHEISSNNVCWMVGNKIRIWNINVNICETTLTPFCEGQQPCHTIIMSAHLHDDIIATVSRPFDHALQIWSLHNKKCLMNINHRHPITAIAKVCDNRAYTVDKECIRMWDLKSGNCIVAWHLQDQLPTHIFLSSDCRLFSLCILRQDPLKGALAVLEVQCHNLKLPTKVSHPLPMEMPYPVNKVFYLAQNNVLCLFDSEKRLGVVRLRY